MPIPLPLPRAGPFEAELKWLFPAIAAGAVRAFLSGVCSPERPHPENVVHTIYLDSADLASYGEKRSSDYRKTKVRLRWYDEDGPTFAEIKRRVGHQRVKNRLPLSVSAHELAGLGLADPRFGAVLAELSHRFAAHGEAIPAGLTPVVRLRYRRLRLLEPGSAVRVSLDTEIRAEDLAPLLGGRAAAAAWCGAVVEFKGSTDTIPAALAPLGALGGRRAAISKYAAVLEARR